MPKFIVLEPITAPVYGLTLHLPLLVGDCADASEDEAIIMRSMPAVFSEVGCGEVAKWTGAPTQNRMVASADNTKQAEPDAGGRTDDE